MQFCYDSDDGFHCQPTTYNWPVECERLIADDGDMHATLRFGNSFDTKVCGKYLSLCSAIKIEK